MTVAPALRTRGLTKSFGGTRALRGVDLDVRAGSIHAVVGGNGSGKSTLIKVLAGVERADTGTIEIGGHATTAVDHSPRTASTAGLRFVHQDLGIFPALSVTENLALGHGYATTRAGRIDWRAEHRRAAELIGRFGIHAEPGTPMSHLRPADHAMVAIARALQDQDEASVLVLDEPTAALPRAEVDLVFHALRRCATAGHTILFVGHRLDEVLGIADVVTVMRDGEVVSQRPAAGLSAGDLVASMLGNAVDEVTVGASPEPAGGPLLSVHGLRAGPLAGVDLDVWPGEVVGVAGLLGSGRSTLLHVLFGDRRASGGSMAFDGARGFPPTVRAATRSGIALVPEGREIEGTFADLSVRHNLSSAVVRQYWRRWRLAHSAERADAQRLITEFGVHPASDSPPVATLSGGNQQKTLIARWLRRAPRLLLLDEPTQGVDAGARADIHRHVRAATGQGSAALYVSSDFEELALVCDRVVVLSAGRVTHEVRAPAITGESLTALCYAAVEEPDAA